MPITKGFRTLVDEAMAQVKTYSVEDVKAKLKDLNAYDVDAAAKMIAGSARSMGIQVEG